MSPERKPEKKDPQADKPFEAKNLGDKMIEVLASRVDPEKLPTALEVFYQQGPLKFAIFYASYKVLNHIEDKRAERTGARISKKKILGGLAAGFATGEVIYRLKKKKENKK